MSVTRTATRLLAATLALVTAPLIAASPASAGLSTGFHQVQNKDDGRCLDVLGAKPNNGADVGVWRCVNAQNQRWQPEEIGNGYVRLRVEHTSKCLSVQGTDNGSNVVQDVCEDRVDQQWLAIDLHGDGWSWIVSATGRCLDRAHSDVTIWSCQDASWQFWQSLG